MENTDHIIEVPKDYEFVTNEVCADGDELRVSKLYRKKPIKKPLPKTWEELGKVSGYVIHEDSSIHAISANADFGEYKSIWPTRELSEAALALSQLLQLRDVYNEGQEIIMPTAIKRTENNSIGLFANCTGSIKLNNPGITEKFCKAFKDLIEQAKPLL